MRAVRLNLPSSNSSDKQMPWKENRGNLHYNVFPEYVSGFQLFSPQGPPGLELTKELQ